MRQTIDVTPLGGLPGIRVIGCHGVPHEEEVPARLAAVLADATGHLIRIEGIDDAGRALVEQSLAPLPEGELPGDGRRIGPWPARLGDTVVALGPNEVSLAADLSRRAREPGLRAFLLEIAKGQPGDPALRWERQGEIVLWTTGADEAYRLWLLLGDAAEATVFRAALAADPGRLQRAAWRLARSARCEGDIYLAAAALERARSAHAPAVLRLLGPVASAEKQERLEETRRILTSASKRFGGGPRVTDAQLRLRNPVTVFVRDELDAA